MSQNDRIVTFQFSSSAQQTQKEQEKQLHKELFNKFLEEKHDNDDDDDEEEDNVTNTKETRNYSTSFIVDRAREKLIISYLKGKVEGKINFSFRFNILCQRYSVQTTNGKDILYRTVESKQTKRKYEGTLPVAIKEDFFDILYSIHSLNGHGGQIKTADAVKLRYHNLPQRVVTGFIRLCSFCNLKQQKITQSRPKRVKSNEIFEITNSVNTPISSEVFLNNLTPSPLSNITLENEQSELELLKMENKKLKCELELREIESRKKDEYIKAQANLIQSQETEINSQFTNFHDVNQSQALLIRSLKDQINSFLALQKANLSSKSLN